MGAQLISANASLRPGDENPQPFSYLTDSVSQEQIHCYLTRTTPEVHAVIQDNLHRAPMYTGRIQSTGPRYCPSIEDKVVRFADRDSHQIFLEPEGTNTLEVYCNGISTSLPRDVQDEMIRRIPGCEQAQIMRYGYAVEYDFAPPTQLFPTLETRRVEGLYFAGQINGTTGYEEAAGQGLLAGINAALKLRGDSEFVLERNAGYLGVLMDDLVTKGVDEPYRMFTSRAEYRLLLRQDNADRRLTPLGIRLGLVCKERQKRFEAYETELNRGFSALTRLRYHGLSLEEWLRRPDTTWDKALDMFPELRDLNLSDRAVEQLRIETQYAGYIRRQSAEIERLRRVRFCSDSAGFSLRDRCPDAARSPRETRPVSPDNRGAGKPRQRDNAGRHRSSDVLPRTGQFTRTAGATAFGSEFRRILSVFDGQPARDSGTQATNDSPPSTCDNVGFRVGVPRATLIHTVSEASAIRDICATKLPLTVFGG